MKLLTCCVVFTVIAFVLGEEWSSDDNPELFSSNYQYELHNLPTDGELSQLPWSDTYWPSYKGGISFRWNSDNPEPFQYSTYTLDQLKELDPKLFTQLSPAEKFDIYNSRYDYPTVRAEWLRTSPNDATWEGICHGWAPASLFYSQPDAVSMQNADGLEVPFGSSDVKALLSYWTAMYDNSPSAFIGDRCDVDLAANPSQENTTSCKDMNAGSLHILFANQLNKTMNEGFVGDRDRGIQVWNQPIAKFESQITNVEAHPTLISGKRAFIQTAMTYGKETPPQWDSHDPYLITENYQYYLDIDDSGYIVGGDFEEWDRLDFAWKRQIADFSDYFATLEKVYQASIQHADISAGRRAAKRSIVADNLLEASTGSFEVKQVPIPKGYKNSWSVQPDNAKSVSITFNEFGTVRHRDLVKIFEGAAGEGPLVAVLHGDELKQSTIIVNAPSVYIVFTAETGSSKGFSATYTAL